MAAGFRTHSLALTQWQLPERYEPIASLGRGAFGQVISALDRSSNIKYAIKKFTRAFETHEDAKRVFREIRLLRVLTDDHQSADVIELSDVFTPEATLDTFEHIYLVTPLMPADLNALIQFQPLSGEHVRFIMYQIIRALKYLHSANIVHRDLKPSNIAIDDRCKIKILDFGLARSAAEEDSFSTRYVQTRWYRAPEVLLDITYTPVADLWSAGCILSELLNRKVLLKGQDSAEQMRLIANLRGFPSDEFISQIENTGILRFLEPLRACVAQPIETVLPTGCPLARDCLDRLLSYHNRPTADEMLRHAYFAFPMGHNPATEPVYPGPIDATFEATRSIDEWRAMIFAELAEYQQQRAEEEPALQQLREHDITRQQLAAALARKGLS